MPTVPPPGTPGSVVPDPTTDPVGYAQYETLLTQEQDEISQMNTQQQQDSMQTAAQEMTSWANTMNTIAKEFSDVSAAKMQQGAESAKATSDEAKQA